MLYSASKRATEKPIVPTVTLAAGARGRFFSTYVIVTYNMPSCSIIASMKTGGNRTKERRQGRSRRRRKGGRRKQRKQNQVKGKTFVHGAYN